MKFKPIRKYKLRLEESITIDGFVLYRIEALRDFSDVKKGDLGGFIENIDSLSLAGDCWVYGDSRVYNCSYISGNSKIYNSTLIGSSASESTVIVDSIVNDVSVINSEIKNSSIKRGFISNSRVEDFKVEQKSNLYIFQMNITESNFILVEKDGLSIINSKNYYCFRESSGICYFANNKPELRQSISKMESTNPENAKNVNLMLDFILFIKKFIKCG